MEDILKITDPKELEKLSKKENSIRWFVALNPNTPKKILLRFSKDPSPVIRQAVARNLHVGEDVIIKLSKDDNMYVRGAADKSLRIIKRARFDLSIKLVLEDIDALSIVLNKEEHNRVLRLTDQVEVLINEQFPLEE